MRHLDGSTAVRFRAPVIELLLIIFFAAVAAGMAVIFSLGDKRWKRAAAWLGVCIVVAGCGVVLIQSWNRAMLRVHRMTPATQGGR